MIERLLQAQAALDKGLVDVAGRLFDQVAQADPRNAIALVGLARVALREDRFEDARELAERALAIDPEEAAAQRLLREVHGEVAVAQPLPEVERPAEAAAALAAANQRLRESLAADEGALAEVPAPSAHVPAPSAAPPPSAAPAPAPAATPAPSATPKRRRSLLARLRRWLLGPRS